MSLACKQMEAVPGCLIEAGQTPQPVVIHYEYRDAASGAAVLHATRYTDAAGVPIALTAAQSVVPGACPLIKTDVEQEVLCDDADGNPATPGVMFLRRFTRTYDQSTGALLNEVTADFALDGTTPYAVVGVIGACQADLEYDEEQVCDAAGVAHIRRTTTLDGGQTVTLGFFNPTTGAASTPTGAVGPCPSCAPAVPLGVVTTWG